MIDGNPFAETVLDGSLLAALPVAALAGLVSFASPCVLPLVPGYLGYVTGLTGIDLQKQKRGRMLAGIGLMGGAMLRDFAIVATACEVDVEQAKKAGLIGVVALLLGTILPFIVGGVVKWALAAALMPAAWAGVRAMDRRVG